MPYQYNNFCHATLEEAVKDEFDNGPFIAGSIVYTPLNYSLGATSATINYDSPTNAPIALNRVYATCADVGYPSITGLTMGEGVILNSSVVVLWCIAFGLRAARKTA